MIRVATVRGSRTLSARKPGGMDVGLVAPGHTPGPWKDPVTVRESRTVMLTWHLLLMVSGHNVLTVVPAAMAGVEALARDVENGPAGQGTMLLYSNSGGADWV